jgi:hypothetical protein
MADSTTGAMLIEGICKSVMMMRRKELLEQGGYERERESQ